MWFHKLQVANFACFIHFLMFCTAAFFSFMFLFVPTDGISPSGNIIKTDRQDSIFDTVAGRSNF